MDHSSLRETEREDMFQELSGNSNTNIKVQISHLK